MPRFAARRSIPRHAFGLKEYLSGALSCKIEDSKYTFSSLCDAPTLRRVEDSPGERITVAHDFSGRQPLVVLRQRNICFRILDVDEAFKHLPEILPIVRGQGARHILFQAGETVLVCRRLEGEFLAYRNAIPRNNPIQVECDAGALLSSIERVSLIISEKLKSPLRCLFQDGVVAITTKTGTGDAFDQCPIDGDGQNLEIGFNHKYLMDVLRAAPAERLKLELASSVAPCVILPVEGEENFIYMVLPVRLKAGN